MSVLYLAANTAEPLEAIAVSAAGALLTGLTSLRARVRRVSDGLLFDWSDNTFKAGASVVTPLGTLTEVSATYAPGHYSVSWAGAAAGTYEVTITQTGTDAANLPAAMTIKVGGLGGLNASTVQALVWDEALTGATHNISTSAGRRLRELTAARLILAGTATAGSTNTITLTGGSASDHVYRGNAVVITAGTGLGQTRTILDYVGSTKVATVGPAWHIAPDNTSEFTVTTFATPAVVDTGTIDGATGTTAILNEHSETADGRYEGMTLVILSGTGAGQSRRITEYVGSTKTATVTHAWNTTPDTTSAYVLLGSALTLSPVELAAVADSIWDEPLAGHATAGSAGAGLSAAAAVSPPSAASIADAVWDEVLSGHAGAGSAGAALALVDVAVSTRATAAAVWATAEGTPSSGTFAYGLKLLRQHVTNRLAAAAGSSGNLVLYDDDGTTPLKAWSLTDGTGAAVTTPSGSPARRSAAT